MPRRGIAVRRVRMRQTAGGIGVPTRRGGRRREAASAAASRVAGIESGSGSGGRRNRLPSSRPSRREREGQRPAEASEKSPCARPGCYELFVPSRRCPHQRFCSCLCRQALRRVIQRETRWGRRRKGRSAKSPPDSALAHESTSPHIVGPWHAGLSLSTAAAHCSSNFPRRIVSGSRATGEER